MSFKKPSVVAPRHDAAKPSQPVYPGPTPDADHIVPGVPAPENPAPEQGPESNIVPP